jgi:excisionase family DNA binding protein
MMIDLEGTITVTEAARRLNRSTEQVRRYLREGKLRGQRVGNQWFVHVESLSLEERKPKPLISPELWERVISLRNEINDAREKRGDPPFDVLEMIRRVRDDD